MVPGGMPLDHSLLTFLGSSNGAMRFNAQKGSWEWMPGKSSGPNSFNVFLNSRTYVYDDVLFEEKPIQKTGHLLSPSTRKTLLQGLNSRKEGVNRKPLVEREIYD